MRRRARWLAHPVVFGAIGALALNDHVLKPTVASWWTGKLSDVAGVIVVSVAAAVVLDLPLGLAVAAGAFVVLKTVPGVAEAMAPVLGGATRRDPSDLLALAALGPVWLLLRDERLRRRCPPRSLRPLPGVALPLAAAFLALLTGTATSCAVPPAVERVVVSRGSVYAELSAGYGPSRWARSTDGGDHWTAVLPPIGVAASPSGSGGGIAGSASVAKACTAGGRCFVARGQRTVDRVEPSGRSVREVTLTPGQVRGLRDPCRGGVDGALSSIVTVPGASDRAVAPLGSSGVLVRSPDGTWSRRGVLDVHDPGGPGRFTVFVLLAWGPLTAVGLLVANRRRRLPALGAALAFIGCAWLGALTFVGMVVTGRGDVTARNELVIVGLCAAAAVVGVLVARSTRIGRGSGTPVPPPPVTPPAPPTPGPPGGSSF